VLIKLRNTPTNDESVAPVVCVVSGILLARGRDSTRGDTVDGVGNHLAQEPRAKVDGDTEYHVGKICLCVLEFGGVAARGDKQKAGVDQKQDCDGDPELQKRGEQLLHQTTKTRDTKGVLEDKTGGAVAGG